MNKIILIFIIVFSVSADNSILDEFKNNPTKRAAILRSLGLSETSKFTEVAFGGKIPKTTVGNTIIKHEVFSQGKELPNPESIRRLYKLSSADTERMRQHDEANIKKRESTPDYLTPELPDCTKSESKIYGTLIESDKIATMDILFINEKDLNKTTKLGKSVDIRIYKPNSSDGRSIAALAIGTTCLPTRYRATNSYGELMIGEEVFKIF